MVAAAGVVGVLGVLERAVQLQVDRASCVVSVLFEDLVVGTNTLSAG